jgi:hypothetical protein
VSDIFSAVTAASSALLVFGLFIAFFQLRTAGRSIKAQLLVKLAEDWRSPDVYVAVNYINRLRTEWRKSTLEKWPDLASQWVVEHAGRDSQATDPREARLWNEWLLRRTASQFLAKVGSLMKEGYLKPDDLFSVIPEMGRLLIVLIPIDVAILEYWSKAEGVPIAEWDSPVGKWEFRHLWHEYLRWQRKNRQRYNLDWTDWRTEIVSKANVA